jgi:predicted acetyltransferase
MAPSPATSPTPSLTPSEKSFYNYYGFHRREELWSIPHSEADDGDDGDEPDEADEETPKETLQERLKRIYDDDA